jgi:glycosyltransferase involved in cell wall biosynthesis
MRSPAVSVVIPVYNGARFLGEALASALGQDLPPLEVIVVDDGSTDATAAVAAGFAGVTYLRQENAGVAVARNTGIAAARGELIALLDADDVWLPEKLRLQAEHLAAHPDEGTVCAHYENFLVPGTSRPAWMTERQLAEPQVGGISNFVARAEAFRRVGAFDPRDPSDIDWGLRARAAGVTMGVVPRVLYRRRVHAGNMTYTADGAAMRFRALRASIARKRAGEEPIR